MHAIRLEMEIYRRESGEATTYNGDYLMVATYALPTRIITNRVMEVVNHNHSHVTAEFVSPTKRYFVGLISRFHPVPQSEAVFHH